MKKKREKIQEKKSPGNPAKSLPNPEDAAFGLLAVVALIFAGLCFGSMDQNGNGRSAIDENYNASSKIEKRLNRMTADYPIKEMSSSISRQNEKVAAFLVAIAKKESDWGKYSPKKNGKECFNYWGYKGRYNRNAAGYSCFKSPEQAVRVVGKRLNNLIAQHVDTPREMVLWKCGQACTARSSSDSAKWVSDVDLYYRKVYN